MLSIKNLNSGYGSLHVLRDVDFTAKPNELIAIIGPNGAGKSTVIKSLFNIANVYSGELTLHDKNLNGLETHELINYGISYVPQGKVVFDTLTVKENLEIGCHYIKDKSIISLRLRRVYSIFPALKEKENELAFALSGGQQQMLAIGLALMQRPRVLLMDEPSLGLSPKLQKEMFTTIESLKDRGMIVIIVEQNAKKAIEIADKTYLLENGKVALVGGKEIVKHPKIKKVYLGGE